MIERGDQRLHDADSAVVGASITPGFQKMSLRDMPMAEFRSFIVVETAVNPQRNFQELLCELQIRRRREDGIAVENQQCRYLAGFDLFHQFRERIVFRAQFDRVGINDGLACIAE